MLNKYIFMKKIILILFISTKITLSQTTEMTGWLVNDTDLSKEFLSAYLDTLENYDQLMSDQDPQRDDNLIVSIDINRDGLINLRKIKSQIPEENISNIIIDSLVAKLDTSLIKRLISRKYSWTELNKDELIQIGIREDVRNIFQERSSKTTRDAFWWTNREFDMSSDLRFVIRPYKSTWGIIVEQGLPSLGYDILSSRTISIGIINEITKVGLITPWILPYESALLAGRPLDGFWGFNLGFETQYLGGEITYQDPSIIADGFKPYDSKTSDFFFIPFSATLYYSNSFALQERSKYIDSKNRFGSGRKQIFPSGNLSIKAGLSYRQLSHGVLLDQKVSYLDHTNLLDSFRFLFELGYITDDEAYSINSSVFFGSQTSASLAFDKRFINTAKFLKVGFRVNWSNSVSFGESSNSLQIWEPKTVFMPTITVVF
jgi:hypothetical protein